MGGSLTTPLAFLCALGRLVPGDVTWKRMNDVQWLAVATAIVAVICFVVTTPDRRGVRHWWRRRAHAREAPRSKIILAVLPFVLLLAAGLLWLVSLLHPGT